ELPRFVAGFGACERRVLDTRPGITDPASLEYRDESALLASFEHPERAYRETVLPRKLSLSLEYLERRTVVSDLLVIVRTAWCVMRPGPAVARLDAVERMPARHEGARDPGPSLGSALGTPVGRLRRARP